MALKRDRLQETGDVEKWFETGNRKITASLVKGDFSNEKQLRVSTPKGYVSARGLFEGRNLSDESLKKRIKNLVKGMI